jgi:uncharacterized protein (DUF2267 family)
MRLTTTLRDAFVRAAMSDVPQIDYQAMTIKATLADAVAQLPPKVRAIYQDAELSRFVAREDSYNGNAYVRVPCGTSNFYLSEKAAVEVAKFKAADEAQKAIASALRQKIRACALACSTRKALLEMLPEFEKYLPTDEAAACRTLPVVANVVSDFVKAGWPKGATKSKSAASAHA